MTTGGLTRTPKILGADVELGNYIVGNDSPTGSGADASRLLLREIRGVSSGPSGDGSPVDTGRRYLPASGACAYLDSHHLEICLPETTNAWDHVAYWRAMLRLARDAAGRANQRLPAGQHIEVVANNSDGLGNSYGSHVNVLLTRRAWNNIISHRPGFLGFLAAFQASSIIFTGAGKVGSEAGQPAVPYQLSQRTDFFKRLLSFDTMVDRGIINSRDEPLCGSPLGATMGGDPDLARLHVIFYDATLCDTAGVLRVGTLQIVVAMLEAGFVDQSLTLASPLHALRVWSRDPSLRATARLTGGERATALQLQLRFLKEARAFVKDDRCDGIVPRANEILDLWTETLHAMRERNFDKLARRLDWVLKGQVLEHAMVRRPELTWASPEIKMLDQLYANLDPATGLYWARERAGLVDRLVSDTQVRQAIEEPPADTRAWTRAHLLRHATPSRVARIDWDAIRFCPPPGAASASGWKDRSVRMARPFEFTEAETSGFFAGGLSLDEIIAALQSRTIHTTHALRRLS